MKNLIEKYFRGETSLEEEATLKAYFNSSLIDEELLEYAPLFQYLNEANAKGTSAGFEERFFQKLDAPQTDTIAELVEKYFHGQTSLEEEATLKAYFNSGQVAPSLLPYQPLFQYFDQQHEMAVSRDFDKKLFAKMGEGARIVRLQPRYRNLLRVAAIGVVLLGALLFLNKPAAPTHPVVNWDQYEIQDEQLAYEETVKALKLLSSKLNKAQKMTHEEISKSSTAAKYLN